MGKPFLVEKKIHHRKWMNISTLCFRSLGKHQVKAVTFWLIKNAFPLRKNKNIVLDPIDLV